MIVVTSPTASTSPRCRKTCSAQAESFLYSRCARIARLMGYARVVTYTLSAESGASLRAVGARPTGPLEPGEWDKPSRPRKCQPVYAEPKFRWEL